MHKARLEKPTSTMKERIQLLLAVMMCTAGIMIIFICIFIDPQGEIDASILVAFGEILTFAGAIFGIDYKYKSKNNN